jgi:hypothetical protein
MGLIVAVLAVVIHDALGMLARASARRTGRSAQMNADNSATLLKCSAH